MANLSNIELSSDLTPMPIRGSRSFRCVSMAVLLLAAACSSDGDGSDADADGIGSGGADAVVSGSGGSGGEASESGGAGGGDTGGAGTGGSDVGNSGGAGGTEEPMVAADPPCTGSARVLTWFPADPAAAVAAFVSDLEKAAGVASVTDASDLAGVPTAEELVADYDAVIFGSNWGMGDRDPDEMGDLLADYVDAGGLMVDVLFNQTNYEDNGDQEFLGGRWASEGYSSMLLAPQINAALPMTTLTVDEPSDSLVEGLDPEAFLKDFSSGQPVYMTAGEVNADSELGFVQLAHWTFQGADHPAIIVSTDPDRSVLGLVMSPLLNFDILNPDATTRDFLGCSISHMTE